MNTLTNVINKQSTGHTLAAGTAAGGSWLAGWLDWIPNDIGKLAVLIGICLSIVLIIMHIQTVLIRRKEQARKDREEERKEELHKRKMNETSTL